MDAAATVPFALALLLAQTVLIPVLGVWDYRRLLRGLREGRADARLVAYRWTIVVQWGLTAGFLAWWLLAGGALAPLGLVTAAAGWQWLVVGAGVAILAFQLFQVLTALRDPEQLARVRRQSGELSAIAPQSPPERRSFVAVSITAGVCEEILYRGLLLAILAATLGTWPAVLLSSAIFGLGHAYQGWSGIGKTAAVGLLLALLAVGSGSLFVPILLHAAVDLTSGFLLSAAAREPLAESAGDRL